MKKSLTLYPTADTFTDSSIPDGNFCRDDFYFLGYFRYKIIYRVFLQFRLDQIPQNAFISKAVLKLYCTRNDELKQQNLFEVHPITEPWNNIDITDSHQPNCDKQYVPLEAGCSVFEPVCADVTSIVRIWQKHPEANYGLMLKAADETQNDSLLALLSSRKTYGEQRPRLEITLDLPEPVKAESNRTKKIAIVTPQFLEWDGKRCIFGGGERYLAELAELLVSMGYQTDVFQPSSEQQWKKEYHGFTIYGIGDAGFDEDFFLALNQRFCELTGSYDLHIYLSMDLTYPYVFPNSICISHGIWWDSPERPWWRSEKWYSRLFTGLSQTDTLVSVDTNTINWLKAVNPEIDCKKVYIPNYADLSIFKPEETGRQEDGKIRVLYPRRLVAGRGWSVTKEIAEELADERPDIVFSFVGRGLEQSELQMRILAQKYPNIEYCWYRMEDMHLAYQNTDIVLIPSYYTEGTSFSLIEAMACGKPVIAGLVGGLTDLVINGFNGLLIQVSKDTLKEAVLCLADNAKLREEMGRHAQEVAQCFSKRLWEQRWKQVIESHLCVSKKNIT